MLVLTAAALAFWLTAALAGAMLIFAAVITPAVFRTLEPAPARLLMRAVFPRYYISLGAGALLAATAAALSGRVDAGLVLGVVAAAFAYARFSLLPRVNALKDRALEGDETAAFDFDRAHRMSLALNAMQLFALLAVAYGLARGT